MTLESWIAAAALALELIKFGREVWLASLNVHPESREEGKKG